MSVETSEKTIVNQDRPGVNGFPEELDASTVKQESAYLIRAFGENGRRIRTFDKGEKLFRMGEDASYIYHLISGKVRVNTITYDGLVQITELPQVADTFGLDALSGGKHSTEAEALVDCKVLRIPVEKIREFILARPEAAEYFFQLVAEAERRADMHLEMLKHGTARSKLAVALFELAGEDEIITGISQETIGERTGNERATINRELKVLADREIVGVTSHAEDENACEIILLDRSRLQAQANRVFSPQLREIFLYRTPKNLEVFKQKDSAEEPELLEIEIPTEEEKWLRTLSQEGMTLGKSLRLLRLDKKLSQTALKKEAHLTEKQIGSYERGSRTPLEDTIEKLIIGLGINPDSKLAQLLYLKRAKREPLSVTELQTITNPALMRYMRIVNNLTEEQLGEKLGQKQTDICEFETGQRPMPKEVTKRFISWLSETSGPAIAQVAELKAKNSHEPLSAQLLRSVLAHGTLFAEHTEELGGRQISEEEDSLFSRLTDEETSGAMIQHIIDERELKKRAISRDAGITTNILDNINTRIFEDRIIVKIMEAMGYDIHNSLTHLVLEQAELDRLKRKDFDMVA
jgi:CRP-like cAMP-binding protein/ribosome-binding protein aMBF1 (putative translation factor)